MSHIIEIHDEENSCKHEIHEPPNWSEMDGEGQRAWWREVFRDLFKARTSNTKWRHDIQDRGVKRWASQEEWREYAKKEKALKAHDANIAKAEKTSEKLSLFGIIGVLVLVLIALFTFFRLFGVGGIIMIGIFFCCLLLVILGISRL